MGAINFDVQGRDGCRLRSQFGNQSGAAPEVTVNDIRLKVRDSSAKLYSGKQARADLDDPNPVIEMINNAGAMLSLSLANDQANLVSLTLLIA
jgi:hypothetical protein